MPAGKGGNIDIKTGSLQLLNDSAISASTYGDGNAGNITIDADSIVLDTGHPQPFVIPGISSTSLSFDGSAVTATVGTFIKTGSLAMRNGMMISVATGTPGNGGNIDIAAGSISIDSAASIQSSSDASGHAGTITLQSSGGVVLKSGSISTSAPQSSAGEILVKAGD